MAILKTIWFFVILVSIINVDGRTSISIEEDKELEQQLKLLNQPALKTIKTKHGDVIDCVDIHKQPSLHHPLLKNHTIQMKPSAFPKELRRGKTTLSSSSSSSTNLTEIKLRRVACPRGTVPIPRIQKEHLIRIKSLSKINKINDNSKDHVTHFAECHIREDPKKPIYGGSVMFSIYNPKLSSVNGYSAASMWIQNFDGDQYNSIQAGWLVHPSLYGDNKTRLYTSWTADANSQTGCYNNYCPGFVQVGSIPLNQVLEPNHGDLQYTLDLLVFKDKMTKNWWLAVSKSRSMVGYWPANLFNLLKDNAKSVVWGGAAYNPGNETGLEMGSGQFLPNQESKTSYAGDLMVVDGWNRYRELNNYKIDTYADKPDCYAVDYRGSIGEPLGYNVLFGGPGGLKCGK